MNFMQKYLYNQKFKKLKENLIAFKEEQNESYQTEKLIKTTRGVPVYLVHCTSSEDGQLYGGFIYVLTTKGFNGCLNYTVLNRNDQSIHVSDISHKIYNQNIGSQLLMFLDEIAMNNNIKKITACISPIDINTHKERLLHFYMKNGYQIADGKDPVWKIQGLIATKYL